MNRRKDFNLEAYLKHRLESRDILLMTHLVIGYPSIEDSLEIVDAMVGAGVDLIELQVPCLDPLADGPVIQRANQRALMNGTSVERCFKFAKLVLDKYCIPFLFVIYFQTLLKYGTKRFVERMAAIGLQGAVIPDLPLDLDHEYLSAMTTHQLAPIFIFTPATSGERMHHIASMSEGMIYCAARKGVTGTTTSFSAELDTYLARCRQATDLPLALGFGVKGAEDVEYLKGKADIAVIGTRMIELIDQQGIDSVDAFIRGLR